MNKNENIEDTQYIKPLITGYTIYSKSGCINCVKIKKYLCDYGEDFLMINCDEYIIENKKHFLNFIKCLTKIEIDVKTFPIIFLNNEFIGGYNETILHYTKLNAFINV